MKKYILNDIAFTNLVIKCLYAEPTEEKIKECENQINLLKKELKQKEDTINKAKEYLKSIKNEPDADMYMEIGDYQEYKYLLKILEETSCINSIPEEN